MTPIQKQRANFYRFAMSLAMALFITTGLAYITDTHAIGNMEQRHCDFIYSESHFTNVSLADYPRCEKRWNLLTNRIKNVRR